MKLWVGATYCRFLSLIVPTFCALVADVPAGNTCALVGVDQYLLKSGTIVTEEDAHPIKSMKFSVSPVVRCAVEPKNAADLPRLVEGMKRLAKSDPLVLCYTEESGEHVIAASGELHLEICLQDLQNDFVHDIGLKFSDPVVSFRETCSEQSSQLCLAKSANKHNRLHAVAEPLSSELCLAIDTGLVKAGDDPKTQGRQLAEDFGWDVSQARKIWAFGPDGTGPNLFVNATTGIQHLAEIKDSVVAGFSWATQRGPLCEEQMRGCRFNLMDVTLHSDSIHRGMGQILPAARRVCYSSFLAAKPVLLEPIYLCNISVHTDAMGQVYGVLAHRRGSIISEEHIVGTPQMTLLAHLPVLESFGFTNDLRSQTGGKAFPQCVFDHWAPMSGDPCAEGKANEIILSVRKRKGLSENPPDISRYLDKL
jgi:elongation factor 2